MTCQGADNVVSVNGMKFPNLAYIGGGVIVAVMFLAVFIGGATLVTALAASQLNQTQ